MATIVDRSLDTTGVTKNPNTANDYSYLATTTSATRKLTTTSAPNALVRNGLDNDIVESNYIKVPPSNLKTTSLICSVGSMPIRRNRFRGKYLGTSMTASQFAGLSSGNPDLFIGDFWYIGNLTWRIVDMDYFLGDRGTSATNFKYNHHIVIMPDVQGYHYMPVSMYFSSYVGYSGSSAQSTLNSNRSGGFLYWLNNNLGIPSGVSIRPLYTTAQGSESGTSDTGTMSSFTEYVSLPTEAQIFGQYLMTTVPSSNLANGTNYSNNPRESGQYQFSLFRLMPEFIYPSKVSSSSVNGSYPLRKSHVGTDSPQCVTFTTTSANAISGTSAQYYYRPYFCLESSTL